MRYPLRDTELFAVSSGINIFVEPSKNSLNVTEYNSYFDFSKNAFFGNATGELITNNEGIWIVIIYPTVIKRSWIKGGDYTFWAVGYINESDGKYRFQSQSVVPESVVPESVVPKTGSGFDVFTFIKRNASYFSSGSLILLVIIYKIVKNKNNG